MKTDRKHTPIPGDRKSFSEIPGSDGGIVLLPDLGMDFAQAEETVMRVMKASGSDEEAARGKARKSLVRAINITPPSSHDDVAVKLRVMCGSVGNAHGTDEEHMVSLRQSLDFVSVGKDAAAARKIYDAAARKAKWRHRPLSPAVEAGLDAVSDCYEPGVDLDAYLGAIDSGRSHQDALAIAGKPAGAIAGKPA